MRVAWIAVSLICVMYAQSAACKELSRCVSVTIGGHDTTFTNGAGGPSDGKALGQVFYATDSVITKITLWRPRWNLSAIGSHLFVVGVDTMRTPFYPVTQGVLQDGPTILVYGDSTGRIAMPFVLDPPLILPHRGYYAFIIQPENCFQGFAYAICRDTNNGYPFGSMWVTDRAFSICALPRAHYNEPGTDLTFEIEYCHDASTTVRKAAWGRVKAIYR